MFVPRFILGGIGLRKEKEAITSDMIVEEGTFISVPIFFSLILYLPRVMGSVMSVL